MKRLKQLEQENARLKKMLAERGSGPLLANPLFGAVTAIVYGMLERRTQDAMH